MKNRLVVNLDALRHNLAVIDGWVNNQDFSWTLVTKVLCGHGDILAALRCLGVRSMGDSRLENLRAIADMPDEQETWMLRVPTISSAATVVGLATVSLNSEMRVIEALNDAAARRDTVHRVVIMIELGDLREGILPGALTAFYKRVFNLPNIEVLGIGSNLGCLAGVPPTTDQFMQLVLYRELLELKFDHPLPLVSAGTSAALPLVIDGRMPKSINHFRIGESVFLGTDLLNGGTLAGLRDDVFTLEAEIIEIKEKSLLAATEQSSISPFAEGAAQDNESDGPVSGTRGYRALVAIGNLDAEVSGITPTDADYSIAGSSSDITVVHVGDDSCGLKVGDTLDFRLNYAALLRAMSSPYLPVSLDPCLDDAATRHRPVDVLPVVEDAEAASVSGEPSTVPDAVEPPSLTPDGTPARADS